MNFITVDGKTINLDKLSYYYIYSHSDYSYINFKFSCETSIETKGMTLSEAIRLKEKIDKYIGSKEII